MDKDEIVARVKGLGLSEGSYVVFGSGPMAAVGLRKAGDIDLFVKEEVVDDLVRRGWKPLDKGPDDRPYVDGVFEAHDRWKFGSESSYDPTFEHIYASAFRVDGVPFAALDEVRAWKVASGRPKDTVDIALIDGYQVALRPQNSGSSEALRQAAATKLLWVDLEMTGLDSNRDVIIEVAAEITDFDFKTLASYEALVAQPEDKLSGMNEWAQAQHDASGLTERVRREGKPEADVIRELSELIRAQFGDEPAVLAGNSIHNDRLFIRHWWPEVESLLHYRMLDVSSFKILMQAKYGVTFDKNDAHRAFDDIQASIAELQHYLDWLRKN